MLGPGTTEKPSSFCKTISDAEVGQDLRGHPFAQGDEPQEQVFRPHVIVVEPLGFFLSDQDDALGAFRKTVRHHIPLPSMMVRSYPRSITSQKFIVKPFSISIYRERP